MSLICYEESLFRKPEISLKSAILTKVTLEPRFCRFGLVTISGHSCRHTWSTTCLNSCFLSIFLAAWCSTGGRAIYWWSEGRWLYTNLLSLWWKKWTIHVPCTLAHHGNAANLEEKQTKFSLLSSKVSSFCKLFHSNLSTSSCNIHSYCKNMCKISDR